MVYRLPEYASLERFRMGPDSAVSGQRLVYFPDKKLLSEHSSNVNAITQAAGSIPSEGIKMATCIATIGPIILVYPFVQKYFVKGIMVGAVKG